jgi:hypothetical protein
MASQDQPKAGGWQKEEMRIDDGAGDPLPPEPGTDDDEADVTVVDVVAVDPAAGEVVAAHVETVVGEDSGEDEPGWNKGQMTIDDGGEAPRRIDPDAMPESEEGPTGLRSNPGGGERFGEIDDGPADRR